MAVSIRLRAQQRWKILASIIKKESLEKNDQKVSVRRFSGFNLFSKKIVLIETELNENGTDYEWVEYRHWEIVATCNSLDNTPLLIKQRCRKVVLEDLIGFDNTGNVCLWPSEEVLASYVLKHRGQFCGKTVCELGAGMTALAGIVLAVMGNPLKVFLTDGNDNCVKNMEAILQQNKSSFGSTVVLSEKLLWDINSDLSHLESQFDFIISADCLFFTQSHYGLLHTMAVLLKDNGCAVIMAPKRKDTLETFCSKALSQFCVERIENYDPVVWSQHQAAKNEDPLYDEDIHYPVLLLLTKKTKKMQLHHHRSSR